MTDDHNNKKIQCHYDVLGISMDAADSDIKKAYRKLARTHHPDKNIGSSTDNDVFLLIQQAYETLSDPKERAWYDEHRHVILKGWSFNQNNVEDEILFDIVPYHHASCYSGYGNDNHGFYAVYGRLFATIAKEEQDLDVTTDFGTDESEWKLVKRFYQEWESFVSTQSFVWEDTYTQADISEHPQRKVRRLMQEANQKQRLAAKKRRTQEVLGLVAFCKRRDVRVKRYLDQRQQEKQQAAKKQKQEEEEKRKQMQQQKQDWKQRALEEMERTQQLDDKAGRIRLADLEDDYDYGTKKKKKKRGKNKKNHLVAQTNNKDSTADTATNEDEQASEEEPQEEQADSESDTNEEPKEEPKEEAPEELDSLEEEEPTVWRCEVCRKDFKSNGQLENHIKSKKHKEALRKYEKKQREQQILEDMMDELEVESK